MTSVLQAFAVTRSRKGGGEGHSLRRGNGAGHGARAGRKRKGGGRERGGKRKKEEGRVCQKTWALQPLAAQVPEEKRRKVSFGLVVNTSERFVLHELPVFQFEL